MHPEVLHWVAAHVPARYEHVIEFGARDTNGTVRHLFPAAVTYTGVDLADGDAVDVVHDAADYEHGHPVDVVVTTELLEHAASWRAIIANAFRHLDAAGVLIVTAAGPGRGPHGQHGAPAPADGEHYENITPVALATELASQARRFTVDVHGTDIRAVAWV